MSYSRLPNEKRCLPLETRPRLLRDCLLEDSNSCSSSGFRSFPRRLPPQRCTQTYSLPMHRHASTEPEPRPIKPPRLSRGRSKALLTFLSALKSLNFSVVKSRSLLPRSISRRLSKKGSTRNSNDEATESDVKIGVTVKDIMRWRSFQGVAQENAAPSYLELSPPHQCTTATTITTTTSASSACSSNSSSWCDSDFTSEFLPSFDGENEPEIKTFSTSVVADSTEAATGPNADTRVGSKALRCNVEELNPVNLERWMSGEEEEVNESEKETFEVEQKVVQLWNAVNEGYPLWCLKELNHFELLLMDFFREELLAEKTPLEYRMKLESELVDEATAWMKGEIWAVAEWGSTEQKRRACIQDIERASGDWIRFQDEEQEVGVDVGSEVTGLVMEDLLAELCA